MAGQRNGQLRQEERTDQSGLDVENLDLGLKEYERFTLDEKPKIEKGNLEDGIYVWTYDMTDVWNNYATSDLVMYEITDGSAVRF